MRILALDSSAGPASVAAWEDGRLLGESFAHIPQTHSQTLLPMVEQLLAGLGRKPEDFDALAVTHGPGSFTGVRIGVSCVKGMAFPRETPCCGVSTLEAIAAGGLACEGAILCAVMDARVHQVYNALFEARDGQLLRLCPDRALSMDKLEEEIRPYGSRVLLLGDGAELCWKVYASWGARLAPEAIRFQRAASVALLAERMLLRGESLSSGELAPVYLRLPQAERELRKRQEENG